MGEKLGSEEFKSRYQISAIRSGLLYDRAMLRRFVRKGILVPEHREEALALLDDDSWMRFRREMTPAGVLHEVVGELYGYGKSVVAGAPG